MPEDEGAYLKLRVCRLHVPDILCMTNVLRFEKSGSKEVPGWRQASQKAFELQLAACQGSDEALPVALPHTRAITYSRRGTFVPAFVAWHSQSQLHTVEIESMTVVSLLIYSNFESQLAK